MLYSKQRIVILAPHTDDGELGCGGSIHRFIKEGHEVYYVAFSTCRQSLPAGWAPDTLEKEVRKATAILGVPAANLLIYDYQVRYFHRDRQAILEDLVKIKRELKPTVVFTPVLNDLHQDHAVVAGEGLRAFKEISILNYELPWNNLSFETSCFIHLDETHIRCKAEALKEYKSQSGRSYINEEFVFALAKTRGVQIGSKYAETFQVTRWII